MKRSLTNIARSVRTFAVTGLLAVSGIATPLSAQEPAFYDGKLLTILVGFSAGGAYDATGRIIARHLGRFLEGEPEIIVSNMPGAGSMVAAATLFNASPRDGTTLGIIGGGGILDAALGNTDVIDGREFAWIGGRVAENGICMVADRVPADSLEDALQQEQEIVFGATGPGSRTVSLPKLMNAVVGTRFDVVMGYPGSSEIGLAIETGEVDGQCGLAWGTVKARYGDDLESGAMKALFQVGLERADDLPDLPLAHEFVDSDIERAALQFLESDAVLAFPLVAPPGIPDERIAELRDAFARMLSDPQFLAEAEQQLMDIELVPGQELQELVEQLYGSPDEVKDIVRAALL